MRGRKPQENITLTPTMGETQTIYKMTVISREPFRGLRLQGDQET